MIFSSFRKLFFAPKRNFCKVSLLNLEEIKVIKDPNDEENPILFLTKRYGALKRIYSSLYSNLQSLDKVYFLDNRCSVNFLFKCLKEDKKGLIIFEPENSNNTNILRIFSGAKSKLMNQYFGTKQSKKNAFRNCKNMKEIFHLNRRIQMEYKSQLARVHVIVNYNGEIRTKDISTTSSNDSSQIANLIPKFFSEKKHDFLLSVSDWQGIYKAGKAKLEGVEIRALNNSKIYPYYSVWPPTQQELYILLRTYIEESRRMFKNTKKCLDIGCGSGVLSLIMATIPEIEEFYAIDSFKDAVECTKTNWTINHPGRFFAAQVFDLLKTSEETANFLFENKFPLEYDVIVANPPWINAKPLRAERELELANYDPDFQFLEKILHFASKYLSKSNPKSKLLLLFSDISERLELCPENSFDSLLAKFKLKSLLLKETSFLSEKEMKSTNPDPLFQAKSLSKMLLFEISRVN